MLLQATYNTEQLPATPPALVLPGTWNDTERAAARSQLDAEWSDISARLARYAAELRRRQAEIATVREIAAKMEATLPLLRQREEDIRSLATQGFVANHAGQDRTRERIELERDLLTQRARLQEAQAALQESENSRSAYLAETRRGLYEREAQARLKLQQATHDHAKASQREALTTLKAPVTGTVQQLSAHTVGGVVTEAQSLMVIVPDGAAGEQLVAEVMLENKDIGFVHAGQAAEVKLETFPFTRYGTVSARVQLVTADAVQDDKRGAVFPARLLLYKDTLQIDGKAIRLVAGMNLSAEIRTGERQVIDYLLSPLQQARTQSLRER
jgi:hemolysin D